MRGLLQAIFLLSVSFTTYTVIGYPILLGLIARFRYRPIRKRFEARTVTILLPVRNGEPWLRAKLGSLFSLQYPREALKIIVISDGSNDATDSIAREFADSGRIEFLRINGGGKAAALNAGLAQARGEILFFTDVRQDLEPESLRNLVACFNDPDVGVASGELVIRCRDGHGEEPVGSYWRYEKWLRNRESQIDSVMGATGCIYAMRRELATPLAPGVLVDDMFLPLAAFFRGYRIVLDGTAKAFDRPAVLRDDFWRKVRTQAGVFQIIALYPRLLMPTNRMWPAFWSHKVARLLLPYALLLSGLTTFALKTPWRTGALCIQLLLYGLALADLWLPERIRLKRVTSSLRTFLVLMAAAFCAVLILFVPSEDLWRDTRARPSPQP